MAPWRTMKYTPHCHAGYIHKPYEPRDARVGCRKNPKNLLETGQTSFRNPRACAASALESTRVIGSRMAVRVSRFLLRQRGGVDTGSLQRAYSRRGWYEFTENMIRGYAKLVAELNGVEIWKKDAPQPRQYASIPWGRVAKSARRYRSTAPGGIRLTTGWSRPR